MFLTYWLIAKAVLLAMGVWWCFEMLPRWRDDLATLRGGDSWSDRGAVIVLWSLTALIAFLSVRFVLTMVRRVVDIM